MILKLEQAWKLIKFEDLEDPSKNTCSILKKEFKTCILKEKDVDAEKAILGNPLLSTFVPQLFQYMKMYTDENITRIHEEFMNNMARNFVNKASHLSITFENLTEVAETPEVAHVGRTIDTDSMTEQHQSQAYVDVTYVGTYMEQIKQQ